MFGEDLDHLKKGGMSLETDGDAETLFSDSSLCQSENPDEVKKANDKGIITDYYVGGEQNILNKTVLRQFSSLLLQASLQNAIHSHAC